MWRTAHTCPGGQRQGVSGQCERDPHVSFDTVSREASRTDRTGFCGVVEGQGFKIIYFTSNSTLRLRSSKCIRHSALGEG
jgi:hypothetical protein